MEFAPPQPGRRAPQAAGARHRVAHRAGSISIEAELALRLSGTRARREVAGGRIAELAAMVDEQALLRFADRQRMLLLILRRLEERTDRPLSSRVQAEVDQLRANRLQRGAMFRLASDAVTRALETTGIPALSLKGAVLAERIYGDEAARVYSDLDVLVAPEQLRQAATRCRALGYGEPIDGGDHGLPNLHLTLLSDALPPLELHWRVHWYERRFAAEMLSRSVSAGGVRVPEPLDELASLLLFHVRDGFVGLRHVADIGAWWDRFGADVAAGALGRHCARYPALGAAWRASALASERAVGLPGRRLLGEGQGALRRREQIAVRLVNWELDGDPDQISADAKLIDGLCTPAGERGAFLRRQVVPGTARICEYYELRPEARGWIVFWTVVHPPKMLLRYALALWSTRRGPRARRGGALPRSA